MIAERFLAAKPLLAFNGYQDDESVDPFGDDLPTTLYGSS